MATESAEHPAAESKTRHAIVLSMVGRIAGPIMAVAVYDLLSLGDADMSQDAKATAAIAAWMAIWWMTEALPLPATSLLPLILFPLSGVLNLKQAAAPYANPFIFLFMGGFMLALAMEKWNLHRRIALLTVLAVGTHPTRMIAGFMIATAFLSMWISNTATTVMMLPIGTSVVALLADRMGKEDKDAQSAVPGFAICLMLGIAYAASIGGVGTLIGTPTNLVLVGFLSKNGISIGFGQWMLLGIPLSVTFLFIAWLLLTRVIYPVKIKELPGGREVIRNELRKLGPMSRGELTVLIVFALTATAWLIRGPVMRSAWFGETLPQVKALGNSIDSIIAITAALALFAIPVDWRRGEAALDWPTAKKLPWGILLLFGGGLSLAAAMTESGLATWIGEQATGLQQLPLILIIATIVACVIFLTEITSNTPTAAAFIPILFGVAGALQVDPMLLLVPTSIAASYAFMLPVATPPNAIVFGSGHVTIGQMAKAGIWLNLIGIVLIPIAMYVIGARVFGISF